MDNETVLRDWLNGLKTRSPHTARSYEQTVRRFLEAVGKPISELTISDARSYVASLTDTVSDRTGQRFSTASIAQHVSAVRSFLRFCQDGDLIARTPLDGLRRPRVTITSYNRYLDQDEAQRLLKAAQETSPQAYLATAVMLLSGIRLSELTGASWRDVYRDPDGRIGLRVVGKGNKEREIAIQPQLWTLLQADRRRRGLSPELSARDKAPLVADRSRTAYTQSGLWRMLRKVAAKAGIDKPISAHWLRHSFATLAAHNGATAYDLQETLGHAKLETSQRYIHMTHRLERSAAWKVNIELPKEQGQSA